MAIASVSSGTELDVSLVTRGCPPGERRKMRGTTPSLQMASNDQVSWLAPPESRESASNFKSPGRTGRRAFSRAGANSAFMNLYTGLAPKVIAGKQVDPGISPQEPLMGKDKQEARLTGPEV